MADIVNINTSEEMAIQNNDVEMMTEVLLKDARDVSLLQNNSVAMPLAQLSTLGAGVSSLLPAFNTVTQTMTMNTQGLYQLANASVGDALKVAKNGNFWGAFKTAEGGSKFAQLAAADPVSEIGRAHV